MASPCPRELDTRSGASIQITHTAGHGSGDPPHTEMADQLALLSHKPSTFACRVCAREYTSRKRVNEHIKRSHPAPTPINEVPHEEVIEGKRNCSPEKSTLVDDTRREFPPIDTPLFPTVLERVPEPAVKRYADVQKAVTTTQNLAFATAAEQLLPGQPREWKSCDPIPAAKDSAAPRLVVALAVTEHRFEQATTAKKRKGSAKERDSKAKHVCPTCGIAFHTLNQLSHHARKHSQSKAMCKYCQKVFYRIEHKTRHERTCRMRCSKAPATLLQASEAVCGREATQLFPVRGTESDSPGMDPRKFSSVEAPSTGSGIPIVCPSQAVTVKEHEPEIAIVPDAGKAPSAPNQLACVDPDLLKLLSEEIIKDRGSNEFAIDIPGVKKTNLVTLAMRGESCRTVKKLRIDTIRYRYRFNQLKTAYGRGFNIFVLMLSCLPPTKTELLEGTEDVVQHKKNVMIGTTKYFQFSASAEIIDESIESPRRLMFFSRSVANIPPSLGNDNVAVIGLDNIRMTKGSHGDYYTANDDSGWAIFSLTGDLMCSFQWPMDERLTMYLNPVLEYAKGYKGLEAKESDLYFYEDSTAVPTRGEHDIAAEEQKYLLSLSKMNAGQKQAISALIDCLHDGSGVLFLDGPAGTGKTFIIQAFISYIYSQHKKPIIVASTGLAASLYEEGCTAHSMFRIPFCVNDKTVCALSKSWRTKLFREADILIWDEAVCIEKNAVEAVERGFKELRANQHIFGGLLVVFCGDFRQVLPVIQKSALENTIQQSTFWQHTKILRLSVNMRAKDDTRFASLLMEIGNGVLESVTIPPCCSSSSLDELINFVFPQFEERLHETGYFENRAILAATNYLVDKVNSILLKRIAREEKIYTWIESTTKRYKNDYIRERIALKVGCPVMILANLGHGLCNGTRMICLELGEETILGKVLTGICAGKCVEISRIATEKKQQFPVALCFAMTINKAQGQTLDRVGLYLAAPVFAHGQLYCAFSRARSLDGVKVWAPANAVKNIVKKSILL